MKTELGTSPEPTLTDAELYDFAQRWYQLLDVHAPLEAFIPLLADEGLKMVFPEGTMTGLAGFQQWYERVVTLFFDEVHTLKQVKVISQGDRTTIKVIVKWEGSIWHPPAPRSERIVADAYQTWELVRSPTTGKPIILSYVVDSLNYYEGSARL